MEKFHFNWKMDSFTSWHGFLGQCSTTYMAAKHQVMGGGCGGKRAALDQRAFGPLRTNRYHPSSSSSR